MTYYEIATLTLPFGTAGKAAEGVEAFTSASEARGSLLGAWTTDIGGLNKFLVLRGFETEADLGVERARTLASANPFGSGDVLTGLVLESYAPFPFLPPVAPGAFGSVYEFRTYRLKTGGLEPTLAAWKDAVPGRSAFSPLTIALYALDGVPRITHIWPYADLNARAKARGESVAAGVWPPKGGPDWLTTDMVSTIAMPAAISPLR